MFCNALPPQYLTGPFQAGAGTLYEKLAQHPDIIHNEASGGEMGLKKGPGGQAAYQKRLIQGLPSTLPSRAWLGLVAGARQYCPQGPDFGLRSRPCVACHVCAPW